MNRTLAILLLAAGLGPCAADAQTVAWDVALTRVTVPTTTPGENQPAGPMRFAAVDAAGRSYHLGRVRPDRDAYFAASYEPDGTRRYHHVFDNRPFVRVAGIAAGASGAAWLAYTARGANDDAVLVKLDAIGTPVWTESPDPGVARSYAVFGTNDGGALHVVESAPGTPAAAVLVHRHAADGATVWQRSQVGMQALHAARGADDSIVVAIARAAGGYTVQKWSADGVGELTVQRTGGAPGALHVAANGDTLLGLRGEAVPRVIRYGAEFTSVDVSQGGNYAGANVTDLASDADGNVYAALAAGSGNLQAVVARLANTGADLTLDWITPVPGLLAAEPTEPRLLLRANALVVTQDEFANPRHARLARFGLDGTFQFSSPPIGAGADTAVFGLLSLPDGRAVLHLRAGVASTAKLVAVSGDATVDWSTTTPPRAMGLETNLDVLRVVPGGGVAMAAQYSVGGRPATAIERLTAAGTRAWSQDYGADADYLPRGLDAETAGEIAVLLERSVPGNTRGQLFARFAAADGTSLGSDLHAPPSLNTAVLGLVRNGLGGHAAVRRELQGATSLTQALVVDTYDADGVRGGEVAVPVPLGEAPSRVVPLSNGQFLVQRLGAGTTSTVSLHDGDGSMRWETGLADTRVFEAGGDEASVYYAGETADDLFAVGRLDRATGAIGWRRTGNARRTPRALTVASGDLYVAGAQSAPGVLDGFVERRRASDGELVAELYTEDALALISALDHDADGNVYAAGASVVAAADYDADALLLKITPSNAVAWTLRHRPPDGNAEAFDIAWAGNGVLYVAVDGDRPGEAAGLRVLRIDDAPRPDPLFADGFE